MPNRLAAGWTATPHIFEEALARAPIPSTHRRVLDVIVRETLGYHRTSVALPIAAIAEASGMSPPNTRRAVVDLERWRVIHRKGAGRGRVAVFRIRPPGEWRIGATLDSLKRRGQRREKLGGVQLFLPLDGVAELSIMPPLRKPTYARELPTLDSARRLNKLESPATFVSAAPLSHATKESVRAPEPENSQRPKPKNESAEPAGRDPWLDVDAAHATLSRRLEELGFAPLDDLWRRCGKALAHGRSRDRIPGNAIAYVELWILEDLAKLGRQPTRRRGTRMPQGDSKTEDLFGPQTPQDPFDVPPARPPVLAVGPNVQSPAERRLAAARMILRWRSGGYPTPEEAAEHAETLTDAQVESTFVELARRRGDVADRDSGRCATQANRSDFHRSGKNEHRRD